MSTMETPYIFLGFIPLVLLVCLPYILNAIRRLKAPKIRQKNMSALQRQGILYGAFISAMNRDYPFDSLAAWISYGAYRRTLKRDWGITDRETALECLDDLAERRASTYIDEVLEDDFASCSRLVEQVTRLLKYSPYSRQSAYTSYAWDVGRLSSLAKWCFWLGYISREELDAYFAVCVKAAAECGRDWDEFAYSYLLGRTIHGFPLGEMLVIIKNMLPRLKKRPFSLNMER